MVKHIFIEPKFKVHCDILQKDYYVKVKNF